MGMLACVTVTSLAYANNNLFYGSSEFENLSLVVPDKPLIFEIRVQYDDGPDVLRGVTPVFLIYPEDISKHVFVESEVLESLVRGEVKRIRSTMLVDSVVRDQKIFVNVYFAGTDTTGVQYEGGWIDSAMVTLFTTDGSGHPDKSMLANIPPLKQLQYGIKNDDVVCKEGFVLVVKAGSGSPSCVKPETKNKLLERGWMNAP